MLVRFGDKCYKSSKQITIPFSLLFFSFINRFCLFSSFLLSSSSFLFFSFSFFHRKFDF